MQPIDWIQVGMIAVGVGIGTLVGYRLTRNRVPSPKSAIAHPGQRAALLALVAFLGGAVAEDLVARLGRGQPGGAFLVKYLIAAATGIGQYAHLRRAARVRAGQARALQGSSGAGH